MKNASTVEAIKRAEDAQAAMYGHPHWMSVCVGVDDEGKMILKWDSWRFPTSRFNEVLSLLRGKMQEELGTAVPPPPLPRANPEKNNASVVEENSRGTVSEKEDERTASVSQESSNPIGEETQDPPETQNETGST